MLHLFLRKEQGRINIFSTSAASQTMYWMNLQRALLDNYC